MINYQKSETLKNQISNQKIDNQKTHRKLQINYKRNQQQDHTKLLDNTSADFKYQECKNEYWNPEEYSLLYGTPLWEEASSSQRIILNQLYWVAYYSQIISAEIATIFFNQTSAAGLYAQEDFRSVCDMLDLESSQERAHINAFKTISKQVEQVLFDKQVFGYPMRIPYAETMIFANTNTIKTWWKKLQLQSFGMLSAGNTFLACQYFTVRGLRTLNGKMVQHKLSNHYQKYSEPEEAPIPSKVSYYHFMDESFHFNSSTIISQDVIKCLKPPTNFEKLVANLGIYGCQKDHYHFSVAVNGIFWYDPALYTAIYQVLRSPVFEMSDTEAKETIRRCFTEETEALHRSYQTHTEAMESYKVYLRTLDYVWKSNHEMSLMRSNSIPKYLKTQKIAFRKWEMRMSNK
ncbi:P-aminobenzoate N-oxygenase AurF [Mastigocoleus testarum]|uniref:p-aminobenzoate N-oxygenase AurF n=1 Tax=Mastigocoleus testarum BC008 TaxID=371196 RepID=A0A0V7ZS18_9CYAN|nr:P-aminobenzoate N-oxygenase AurF [Mastigocoleus testarum]KST67411.1 P-aminobenzoate N-oxygenase AurF [Mastigocoleus testarum BC008]